MTEVECKRTKHIEKWFIKGTNILHRDDGPARIYFDANGNKDCEVWYKNGQKHREDGPAMLFFSELNEIIDLSYFVNGKNVTEWAMDNINDELDPTPEEIALLRLTCC